MITFIVFGVLFTIKHFLADWKLQSNEMSNGKRLKGWDGVEYLSKHSFVHSALTFTILVCAGFLWLAIVIALIEFVLHFSIDYCKIIVEKRHQIQFKSRKFWMLLTVDQGLHFLCYLGIILALTYL